MAGARWRRRATPSSKRRTAPRRCEVLAHADRRWISCSRTSSCPMLNGRELGERLAASRPGLRVLFMSGYTDDDVVRRGLLDPDAPFLQKPFMAADLSRKVREVLDSR